MIIRSLLYIFSAMIDGVKSRTDPFTTLAPRAPEREGPKRYARFVAEGRG